MHLFEKMKICVQIVFAIKKIESKRAPNPPPHKAPAVFPVIRSVGGENTHDE